MANDSFSADGTATIRKWATRAAVIGALGVGASLSLDTAIQNGLPQITILRSDGRLMMIGGSPKSGPAVASKSAPTPANGVDMTAVGSIRIDPCTGQKK